MVERTQWLKQLARRPDRTGDDNRPPRGIGDFPGEGCRLLVDLMRAPVGLMQRQPPPVAAECVGENDIGTGIDEHLVKRLDPIRMLFVPNLRRVTRHQSHVEQVGTRRTIGEEPGFGGKHGLECGHGTSGI